MIFEVTPEQIEKLDSKKLVQLLGRLLHAKSTEAGIQLGGISVPLQIDVPDAGEDGRIEWSGGRDRTNYLPGRLVVFQAKATRLGPAGWKKECWTKGSQGKGKVRLLSGALQMLIGRNGSYVGFTSDPLGGIARDKCVAAIRAGISEAGGDPDNLYGANQIAEWSQAHPSVAVWLAERSQNLNLGGFQTIESWGSLINANAPRYVTDKQRRFAIGEKTDDSSRVDAAAASERIVEHIAVPGRLVRLVGQSGLGKSRFVYEFLRRSSLAGANLKDWTIFCDYRVVGPALLPLASRLALSGRPCLLVVDECPHDVATTLDTLVSATGSKARAITIDIDDERIAKTSTLTVTTFRADEELTAGIVDQLVPGISDDHRRILTQFSDGFPRFAVLASRPATPGTPIVTSIADVVDRIVGGAGLDRPEERRTLECLCLFDGISVDDLDALRPLTRMSGDEVFEYLSKARKHDLVGRRRGLLTVQPLPVANFLGIRRLESTRPSSLERFLLEAPPDIVESAVRRWRHFDTSSTLVQVASKLLMPGEMLGDSEALLSKGGARVLEGLVHLVPDQVAGALQSRLLPMSVEDLAAATESRRELVRVLTLLVSRQMSFPPAARLLMKLAAAENETWANNATGLFVQLFQVQLGGTEATPIERFAILDEGLESGDQSVVRVCLLALEKSFETHSIRFGDIAQIGSALPFEEWRPKTWAEIHEFLWSAVKRLTALRSRSKKVVEECERVLARATRRMLNTPLYAEYGELIAGISAEKGVWLDAIAAVGDWLYFDRPQKRTKASRYVRKLYDRLFPLDVVGQALLFTRFWAADIRDPDVPYSKGHNDFGYSERRARALARQIAADETLAREAVAKMVGRELNGAPAFAQELAEFIPNPKQLFDQILEAAGNNQVAVGFIRGFLSGVDKRDAEFADELMRTALERPDLRLRPIQLQSVLQIDEARLARTISALAESRMSPEESVLLSYGRGLDDLSPSSVARLVDVLLGLGSSGVWAGLEVAMMYRYGDKPLSPEVGECVQRLLVAPGLIAEDRTNARDTHLIEALSLNVRRAFGIGGAFADGLTDQILALAKSESYSVLSHLKDAFRKVAVFLAEDAPEIIWSRVARFVEIATPAELDRIVQLVGVDQDNFDDKPLTDSGPLFQVGMDKVTRWADGDPMRRGPFLVELLPMLNSAKDELNQAALEVINRYGGNRSVRAAFEERMRPRSWSGSIVPLLQVYLMPLSKLFIHENDGVAAWAKELHRKLQRRIDRENESELADVSN